MMQGLRQRFFALPMWGQYTVVLVPIVLIIIALLAGGGDDADDDDGDGDQATALTKTTTTATSPTRDEGVATQTVPAQSVADARQAVDADDYPAALTIIAALTARDATVIRRRVANRLGTRALAALRMGDRRNARRFIIDAKDYPSTARVSAARSQYKAAKARAALRQEQRVAAARQRREAAAAQRELEAAQAAPEPAEPSGGSACDANYSGCVPAYPPDVDCGDLSGSVQVTGSDPHGLDRDGDGVGCE